MMRHVFRVCFVLAACFFAFPVKPALLAKDLERMAILADVAHVVAEQAYIFKCSACTRTHAFRQGSRAIEGRIAACQASAHLLPRRS